MSTLDQAAEHVRAGYSLREALRLADLPQTKRMQLSHRLTELGVAYRWRGKGMQDDTQRLRVLRELGAPCPGDIGYWRRFAAILSRETNKPITAETVQLWYTRRFGKAYVRRRKS